MSLFMDDIAIIQRILDHISSKKTDLGTRLWREPVDNYRSKERFDLEIELLKRLPMVFCPSAAIPEPGSYLARTVAGTPLLSVRGNDGTVRTFHNSCRHRGMILAEGCGKTHGFICSYHAWAYGLDGTLKNIAGRDGFPGLNKEEHGLIAVDTTEKNGLVFVTQKKPISRGVLKNYQTFCRRIRRFLKLLTLMIGPTGSYYPRLPWKVIILKLCIIKVSIRSVLII